MAGTHTEPTQTVRWKENVSHRTATHLIVKKLPVWFVERFVWSHVQVACCKALSSATEQDKHMPSTVITQGSTHMVNSHHTRLAARHTSRQQPSHKTLAAGSRIQHNFIVPVRKFIWPNTHPGITAMQIPLNLFLSFCIPP